MDCGVADEVDDATLEDESGSVEVGVGVGVGVLVDSELELGAEAVEMTTEELETETT